jgi:3-hydroxymyristoyl/3-hydroxydecanoyl-(acyl carrier protein) dehydratase
MVTPGDCLESEAEVLWFRKGVGCMKGISRVNGETVAEAELTFKLMNEDNGA